MAVHERAEESTSMGIVSAIGRLLLIAVFTGVETAALGIWLALVRDAPVASRAAAIGVGVLLVGFLIEHFLTDVAVNGLDVSIPGGKVIAFSVSETALWVLWLSIADRVGGAEGFLIAAAVLAVLLVPQHTIEDNVLRGRGFFSSLINPGTVGFSLIESVGATIWLVFVLRSDLVAPVIDLVEPLIREAGLAIPDLALVGLAILAVALFIEHSVGVAFSRRM